MAWYDENRMAVEGQRYQEELYARDEEDDHILMVHADGTVVYEDGYGMSEYGEVIYFCDIYECEDCPVYGDSCDGKDEL